MGVIDFKTAYDLATQAGQEIVEGNVVKIIADNGDEIGDATLKVIQGGNGSASNVWTMVKTAVSGAITTGVTFMAMDLPVVFAAVAPCLGVVAGTGIYEVVSGDTDFHNRVLEALKEEGKTIGGKIITYFNGDNIAFDEQTIEIIKNQLLLEGVFDVTAPEIPDPLPTSYEVTTTNGSAMYSLGGNIAQLMSLVGGYDPNYLYNYSRWFYNGELAQETLVRFKVPLPCTLNNLITYVGGIGSDSATHDGVNYSSEQNKIAWYYPRTGEYEVAENSRGATYRIGNIVTEDGLTISGNGGYQPQNPEIIQPDAVLPDDDPFPLRYPKWYPWEYPQTVPQPEELPKVYPTKYPETQPDPYPAQEPAQNPEPENVPETYPEIMPDFNIPTPSTNPTPEPTPDPDPTPSPDPIPTPDEPTPSPDPVNPNPDPTPSPVIPPVPTPDTVSSSKLFTVYNPTQSQLDSLGGYLWDDNLMEILKKIWQNPLDGIISLSQVYATPTTGGAHNIILGYLDSGVSANVVTSQFVTVDCGNVQLKETKKNATDYSPYTSLHIFLPFIGITELDVNECMNATINVTYKIDVYTGTCLATVKITRSEDMPNGAILYTYNGNCSQQLPLTSGDASGLISGLLSAVGSGLAIASGGGLGLVAGASLVGQTLNREMLHVSHSGNISANSGIMGNKKPYLIIGRAHGYDANAYNTFYGFPANKNVFIGNCTGYIRVKECHLQTSATDTERNEIEQLLRSGVIL